MRDGRKYMRSEVAQGKRNNKWEMLEIAWIASLPTFAAVNCDVIYGNITLLTQGAAIFAGSGSKHDLKSNNQAAVINKTHMTIYVPVTQQQTWKHKVAHSIILC